MDKIKLRIAYYVYPTAFQNPGGGEIQLLKTRQYLEELGVEIKLFDQWTDNLRDFDILHVFGSVKDCLPVIQAAKVVGTKVVLSTICWYSWKSAWGTHSGLKERSISILRHLAKQLFPFVPSQRKTMMDLSDLLFPNSENEAAQLSHYFLTNKKKIRVIPNGVDPHFQNATPDAFVERYGLKNFILCVGRIEPRKNQLGMIRALRGINIPVVFIGRYVSQYHDYYAACKREAGNQVYFLNSFEHGSGLLASAYAACNTFLLASWLETPGLAALEAGLAGAKVVITDQGATKEYFQNHVIYTSPDDPEDIRAKTLESYTKPASSDLKQHILKNYLWKHVAEKNLEQYLTLTGKNSHD